MKKLLLLVAVTVAALNLSGCVVLHSQTEIKGDGSGTAEISMSISPTVKEALQEMKTLNEGQSQDMDLPILEEMSRADVEKAIEGHGVKLEKFEKGESEGRETMTIGMSFKDLEGFSYAMGRVMGGDESGGGMGIFDAGDGNLVLKEAVYDFPPEPEAETKAEPEEPAGTTDMDMEKAQKQMELAGKLMAAISELDVSVKITVPGDIVSSNAPTTEGRTSIWAINAGNMMTMGQEFEPKIVFSGKGLKIKPMKE